MKKTIFVALLLTISFIVSGQNFILKKIFKSRDNYSVMNKSNVLQSKTLIGIDSIKIFDAIPGEEYQLQKFYLIKNWDSWGQPMRYYLISPNDTLEYADVTYYNQFQRYFTDPDTIFSEEDLMKDAFKKIKHDGQWITILEKRGFEHPIYGKIDSFLYEIFYDTTENEIQYGYKERLFFRDNIFIDSAIFWEYDESVNQMFYSEKIYITQNTEGYLTELLRYTYKNNQWIKDSKETITYNDQNQVITDLEEYWNDSASQWINKYKYEYIYLYDTLLTSSISYQWDNENETWIPMFKYIYTYENNMISVKEFDFWDTDLQDWVPENRIIYRYNANNDFDSIIQLNFNIDSSRWENYYLKTFEYNQNNLVTAITGFFGNIDSWMEDTRYEYVYNEDNLIVQYDLLYYDPLFFTWDSYYEEKRYYDDQNRLEKIEFYNNSSGVGLMIYKVKEYSWKEVTAKTENMNLNVNVYPNPANSVIYIPFSKANVKIYNIDGKFLYNDKITNGQINIEKLQSGIYILKILYNNKLYFAKVVKE